MAASLSLSACNVQTETDHHAEVALTIRANKAQLRRNSEVIAEADIAAVRRIERGRWLLTLGDGTQWAVEQHRRRCCGGRR
jgi:outer membrane scaffolding protein for murein synthesis (MipA/OmpV family)